jgi:hypothetical protein
MLMSSLVRPVSAPSGASTISPVLAQTYVLRDGDRASKRRWAMIPALDILTALENVYVVETRLRRDHLASIIVDELIRAPPRPGGHWANREAWTHALAARIADVLAPIASLRRKARSAMYPFDAPAEPTWR